jgi:uncharacterized GH25 family protein
MLAASVLLLGLCGVSRATAHDFWIEPATFRPKPGSPLAVRLRLGDHFQGEIVPRRSAHLRRFFLQGPRGAEDVRGVEGMDPAGYVLVAAPGLYALGYQSAPNSNQLEARKFEEYLEEEGLSRIARLRADRGAGKEPGREVYHRYARSLVWAGDSALEEADRPIGFPLEIVAEKNPYVLRPGEELPVRLLFQGAPLSDTLVRAIHESGSVSGPSGRTDAEGRIRLELGRAGAWLVKSVHMVEAPPGGEADWESFWASLTFQVLR